MTKANGGAAQVMNWSRFFLVPGMSHCGGGAAALDSFDMIGAAVEWVEKGTAPVSVTATGRRSLDAAARCAHIRSTPTTRAAEIRTTRPASSAWRRSATSPPFVRERLSFDI